MDLQRGKPLSLKLWIDKNSNKVLFAEAEKDFVDFLCHIMTLPVGTVIRLLKNDGMVGCVGILYGSIERIGDAYMVSADTKESVLKPKSPRGGPSFLQLPDSFPLNILGAIPSRGYVKEAVMYMVMDDLMVTPVSTMSTVASLNQFRVKDVGALEQKVIAVGIKEALAMLKTSFYSKNVLTDVFLGNPSS